MFPNVNDLTKKIDENTYILNQLLLRLTELNMNVQQLNESMKAVAAASTPSRYTVPG